MNTQNTFDFPHDSDIQRIETEARRLRGDVIGGALVAVIRPVVALFAPVMRTGRRIAAAMARQRQADRIYSELSRLTDRDLADIGVGRSDIMAIANGAYNRETGSDTPLVVLRGTSRKPDNTVTLDVEPQAQDVVAPEGTHEEFDRAA